MIVNEYCTLSFDVVQLPHFVEVGQFCMQVFISVVLSNAEDAINGNFRCLPNIITIAETLLNE